MATRTPINPWTWQDARGFTQAWRLDGPTTTVYLSGQGPLDAEGNLVGPDDFEVQAQQTLDNLESVLARSGASLQDLVKLTIYLTDITRLPDFGRIKAGRLAGQQPASTALEVTALALPNMMIEIEAIAAV